MVNIDGFTTRLKKIIEYYQLTASLFADKIGVQRSSISHILSGRNKPSLDFILKVTTTFEEVDIYWLLNGKGTFPKNKDPLPTPSLPKNDFNLVDKSIKSSKTIKRIVVFYDDGTFDDYLKH